MAAAETARLIAELSLKDKLTPGVKTATGSVGKLESGLGRMGTAAKRGAAVAGKALVGLGAAAAVGIVAGVKSGLENLATLESAISATDGAIEQMGLTGEITGAQIAAMANEIETNIGAAFDDKDITQATTTLIRYGKIAPESIRPAMEVMTDLAAQTGSVDGAATLLAKALADPTKAAGKLSRYGIILTKTEQDQVKAFAEAGKQAEAQAMLLEILARTTKGAAEASQGPYQRALSTLADVTEDAQKALAEGFLPVIERVAKWLSTSLADPRVMTDIRNLGKSLANVFDQGVSFVQKIPWGTVRDAMSVVGNAAKMALDAFNAMPDWVKTAVITGWGLNKLSGGALTDILGTALKAVIPKMAVAAGIVHVNGPVAGTPGVPGKGGGTPGAPVAAGAGVLSTALTVGSVALIGGAVADAMFYGIPAIVEAVWGKRPADTRPLQGNGVTLSGQTVAMFNGLMPSFERLAASAGAARVNLDRLGQPLPKGTVPNDPTGFLNSGPMQSLVKASWDTHSEQLATTRAVAEVEAKQAESLIAFRAGERTSATGLANTATAARNAGVQSAIASAVGAGRVVSAVYGARPIITTNVEVNVTAASVSKSVTVQSRAGRSNGSAGDDIGNPYGTRGP